MIFKPQSMATAAPLVAPSPSCVNHKAKKRYFRLTPRPAKLPQPFPQILARVKNDWKWIQIPPQSSLAASLLRSWSASLYHNTHACTHLVATQLGLTPQTALQPPPPLVFHPTLTLLWVFSPSLKWAKLLKARNTLLAESPAEEKLIVPGWCRTLTFKDL